MKAVSAREAIFQRAGNLKGARKELEHIFGKDGEASRRLMQCKTMKQVAELQNELATSGVRNWMESSAKMLQITQRASKQALSPLDGHLSETA